MAVRPSPALPTHFPRFAHPVPGLLLGSLALLVSFPLWAQSDSDATAATFGDVIDVRLVNLDVIVTRGDERVEGLGPEDFELRVDGVVVPIEFFTEVADGEARSTTAEVGDALVAAADPGEAVGLNLMVFVDRRFAHPDDQRQVLRAVQDQVTGTRPADTIAIVASDGTDLEVVLPWTTDLDTIEEGLRRALSLEFLGHQRLADNERFKSERRVRERYEAESADRTGQDAAKPWAENPDIQLFKKALEEDIDGITRAAASAMRTLPAPPGRKAMLLLSGGWPMDTTAYLRDYWDRRKDLPQSRTPELLRQVTDTANLLGYTLYSVDMPTVRESYYLQPIRPAGATGDPYAGIKLRKEEEIHTALHFLADRTGGLAFRDGASLRALRGALDDSRSYYWMGFTPDWQGDGSSHTLEIKARRPGLKVRARKDYRDLSRQAVAGLAVEEALRFGQDNPKTTLEATFGEPAIVGRRKLEIPVSLAIPLDAVTMLDEGGRFVLRLELRIATIDDQGRQSDIPTIPLELASGRAPQPGQVVMYDTAIRVRDKTRDVVVAIHDPTTGVSLSARHSLEPR